MAGHCSSRSSTRATAHERGSATARERGSATVEVAMCLPLLTMFLVLMTQVGVVMLDQLAVTQAAREGARAAAVNPSPGVAAAAAGRATRLSTDRLEVGDGGVSALDKTVSVTVRYRTNITLPFTDRVLWQQPVQSTATMQVEADG